MYENAIIIESLYIQYCNIAVRKWNVNTWITDHTEK